MSYQAGLLLRTTIEKDADTVTPIIVTKLPVSALFIQLCCTDCGAKPRADRIFKRSVYEVHSTYDKHLRGPGYQTPEIYK